MNKNNNGLYRPKINKKNYNTPTRYYKFMRQFLDLNDWGYCKRHIYDWQQMEDNISRLNEEGITKHQLKGPINYNYSYVKGKPFGKGKNRITINSINDIKEIDPVSPNFSEYLDQWNTTGKITMHKTRSLCMETHLISAQKHQKQGFLFYTTSPNKDYNIICLDIDEIESDEAYHSTVEFLLSLFPNCYYERSTNGTGLHFYIIVSFLPARYLFSDINEGVYRNLLYYLLSEALRTFVNDNFDVKFDAVKGTNPVYDDNSNFLKFGTLVKLPAPATYIQYKNLYSCRVYPENYILCIINYFTDMTCQYTSGVYTVSSLMDSLQVILKDIPMRSSSRDILSEINKHDSLSLTTLYPTTTITNGGTNGLTVSKTGIKDSINDQKKYTLIDVMNLGDSRVRETLYIKKYVGEYYSKYGKIPSEEDVKQSYRTEMNYYKIGTFRDKRFHKYYIHTIKTFDPDKATNTDPYQVGMYDTVISQSQEELTEWVNNNTSYKRNIYRYDVDITLEYIYICSKNMMNKARELHIQKLAKQEGIPKEEAKETLMNTAPRNGLIGFYQHVKGKFRTVNINGKKKKINLCDPKKASAMLRLVVELGLAKCIDDSIEVGVAKKFELSEEVKNARKRWNYEAIEKVRAKGMANVTDWDSLEQTA
jgi:hypothetical protein